jgi:hypothetical protein
MWRWEHRLRTSHEYYGKTAARVCKKMNFDNGKLAVMAWEHAPKISARVNVVGMSALSPDL